MQEHTSQPSANAAMLGYRVNDLRFDMPWEWLAAGWRDLWRVWPISLCYGAFFSLLAVALLAGLMYEGSQSVILAFAAGFLLVGPMLAVGLYEASRRLEKNEPVTLGAVAFVKTASPQQLAYVGLILTVLFLFWVHIGLLLYALFFSNNQIPTLADFVPMVLMTVDGISMLAVGSIVGGVLAVTAFALSAVSIPLLVDRATAGDVSRLAAQWLMVADSLASINPAMSMSVSRGSGSAPTPSALAVPAFSLAPALPTQSPPSLAWRPCRLNNVNINRRHTPRLCLLPQRI